MKHPDEQTIEKIAIALCVDGCSRGWEGFTRLNVPLARSLDHVRSCARCREILETLIDTEEAWRAGAGSAQPAPSVRILPLRPWQARRRPPSGQPSAGRSERASGDASTPFAPSVAPPIGRTPDPRCRAEEPPEPALAAADATLRPAQARILTLVTDDDRYLVRILGDDPGEGATAFLVVSEDGPGPGEAGLVPVLLVERTEFEFDASNMARLPRFPAAEASLILRERR